MRKTLVLGASTNSDRYSNIAVRTLRKHGHEVVAVGRDIGRIADVEIQVEMPGSNDLDTVTLYLNPERQKEYFQSIISLHPRRVIFNPGTENDEFEKMLETKGIIAERACTLVLLSTDQYDE